MTEELKTKLVESLLPMIEKAKEVGGNLVDVVMEQSPELVREILAWGLVSSLIVFLIFFTLLISFQIGMFKYGWKKAAKIEEGLSSYDKGIAYIITGFLHTFPSIIFLAICCKNFDWLKILVAPRLYLIEYIGYLIK